VILFKLLALPVTAPAAGIRYCLEKVIEVAEHQMWDEDPVREQLILVNEAYEEGRMPEVELILDDMYHRLKKANKTHVADEIRDFAARAADRQIREHKKATAQAQLSSLPDEGPREVVIELPDEIR